MTAYVGLGSNMGDRLANLERAVAAMRAIPGVTVETCSPVYLTEPQDRREQPWFANQVVRLACRGLTALRLWEGLRTVETELGRRREPDTERYAPRPIDLDVLLFGGEEIATPELCLPHPKMRQRAFVLVPLRDIAPDLLFPDGGSMAAALERLSFGVQGNCIRQQQSEW